MGAAAWIAAGTAWSAVERRPEFQVDLLALSLNACPDWVNADRMGSELRKQLSSAPQGKSIFDRDIAAAVARQLDNSPWVLEVKSVQRMLPNNLLVTAVFRKPAALVLMAGRHYMVDRAGHWLPDDLFNRPEEWDTDRLPHVVDRGLRQPPAIGERWDGPRLAVGARLTEFFRRKGLLDRLHLSSIDVTGVGRTTPRPDIVLTTGSGALVKWGKSSVYGRVPGLEAPPFLTPDAEKLEMLTSKLSDYPELSGIQYVDLRFHGQIVFVRSD